MTMTTKRVYNHNNYSITQVHSLHLYQVMPKNIKINITTSTTHMHSPYSCSYVNKNFKNNN